MRKISLFLLFTLVSLNVFSQDVKRTFGINYFLNDIASARSIRSSSLSATLANDRFARIKNMIPGIAVSYSKGLTGKYDFSSTLAASFTNPSLIDEDIIGADKLSLELDASLRSFLLEDKYWVNPYAQIGAGLSKQGGYYGCFIPLGVGLQVSFFDEAYFLFNAQYRIPVINTYSYRFHYSIGIAANLNTLK
jgi:OOP family OmpA-OmpF porin